VPTHGTQILSLFHAGGGVDLIGDAVTMVVQELIEEKATELIGATTNGDDHDPSEDSVALGTQPPTRIHSQRATR
jgi:hypothetical protein